MHLLMWTLTMYHSPKRWVKAITQIPHENVLFVVHDFIHINMLIGINAGFRKAYLCNIFHATLLGSKFTVIYELEQKCSLVILIRRDG